jgi:DNA-binding SARP family transcriptional activator
VSSFDPPLRLRTFGGLSLQHRSLEAAGAALQARRLAVLAVLAVAGERGLTRAKLLGILWPETDEARARQPLSQALYALRRDCQTGPLVIGTESLRLAPAVITSDVAGDRGSYLDGDRAGAARRRGGVARRPSRGDRALRAC